MFFRLSTWELWLIIAGVVFGFVALGYGVGRLSRTRAETLREPVGIVQGAFFALVGLVLAFGLTLAIGRYDARRTAEGRLALLRPKMQKNLGSGGVGLGDLTRPPDDFVWGVIEEMEREPIRFVQMLRAVLRERSE